ncbi:HU family DNA-binding protein [bacterium]|nr:HU family DNA-binding protein [bacterium]
MPKNLTKQELIATLAGSLDLPKSEAESGLNRVVTLIIERLTAYQEITLTGFGAPINIKQKPKTSSSLQNVETVAFDKKLSTIIKKSEPGHEKRKLQRRNFILNIEILDNTTGQTIGDLGDITNEGIMVVSDDPIQEDTLFSILIRLPDEADEKLEIVFDAKSIRCRETVHESIFITGFIIETIDELNSQHIDYLINEYAV